MKKGILIKLDGTWQIKELGKIGEAPAHFPVLPYEQSSLLDSDMGRTVTFKVEPFWETGLEEVLTCAVVIDFTEDAGWQMIWQEWIEQETNFSTSRFFTWLSENFESPKKLIK